MVFGKRVPTCDSQDATQFHDYIRLFSKTLAPGAPPVDLVPFLKYIPERWAPWRRLWKETRTLQRSLYFGLLRQAEQRISDGLRNDSYIEDIMDRQIELDLSREMIAYVLVNYLSISKPFHTPRPDTSAGFFSMAALKPLRLFCSLWCCV